MQNHRSYPSGRNPSHLGAIGTPVSSVAQPSPSVSTAQSEQTLAARVDQALRHDQETSTLLREMFYQCQTLSQEIERLSQEKEAREKVELALSNAMMSNPFVVILIDGDGMIFCDDLIREGDMGGRRSAAQLQTAISKHIELERKNLPLDYRVLCRIYAHISGLGDALVKAGVIDDIKVFQDFSNGFTRANVLFDFVDVGPGKDRADVKVTENLKLFIHDCHCRQIFFGCSHDNGFARPLEEYMINPVYVDKITLMEGVPFEKELRALPYKTIKIPDLFRDSKISINPAFYGLQAVQDYVFDKPVRFPPVETAKPPLVDSGPYSLHTLNVATPVLSRSNSKSTLGSDIAPPVKPLFSWAAKAAAPAPPVSPTPVYVPAERNETLHLNQYGQRVDAPCRAYDKFEVDRVKTLKLCNTHFLVGDCPRRNNCSHLHNYRPTKAEIDTLRLVARMAVCQYGTDCKDVKCIFGHRCSAPPGKANLPKATKNCIFGETCKFPDDLHDIDTNIVKTVVIH